jgi:hypothetical protein
MKSLVAAVTAASAVTLAANSALSRAPLLVAGVIVIVLVLIAVVVVPAVHSPKASKRTAAQEVLRILLGRRRG